MTAEKNLRSKEARAIRRAVERAGGTCEVTGKGNLKITGPGGTGICSSRPESNNLPNTIRRLEQQTGLKIKI